jgi:HAD superfamily hydrolase (TIGR01509 family)
LPAAIEAVVFDMDGLMFNTEDLYDLVCDEILQRRGQRFSLELKLQMMGRAAEEAWNILRAQCNIADPWRFLQTEADRIFESLLPQRIEKLAGLDEVLDSIERRDLPKAVATSSRRAFAERALGHFDLLKRFEFVLTGEDVARAKPHPEIYWRTAAKLGTSCPKMLVFEDSFNGTKAAAESGAITVAVPGSHSQHLDFSHASYRVASLADPLVAELIG